MKTISLFLVLAMTGASATSLAKTPKKTTTQKTETKAVTAPAPVEPEVAPAPEAAPVPPPAMAPAEPVPAAPTPAPAEPTEKPTPTSDGSHLFGLHVAAGLPHPYSAGLNYVHSSKLFSAEVNAGSYAATVDGVDGKMTNMEVGLRWHPFAGSFFIGAYLGNHTITAEKTELVTNGIISQNVHAKAEVKANYVAPNFGWLWGAASKGFFMSMDFGMLTPSGATVDFTSDVDPALQTQQEYKDIDKDVRDKGKDLGETSLPLWTVLKIGWLF